RMTLVKGQVASSPFARPAARKSRNRLVISNHEVQVGNRRYVVSFAGRERTSAASDRVENGAGRGCDRSAIHESTFDNLKRPSFYGAIDVDQDGHPPLDEDLPWVGQPSEQLCVSPPFRR